MINAARAPHAPTEVLDQLEAARADVRFKAAMEKRKQGVPLQLLINGHNPLVLLYSTLSDGLHDQSDEHCLALANSTRKVLEALSERLSQALEDQKSLNDAAAMLLAAQRKAVEKKKANRPANAVREPSGNENLDSPTHADLDSGGRS